MSKIQKYWSLMALGCAGGSIFIIPYIKYVFYDQQMLAMGINNTQSGLLVSVYGIVAIIIMIPGGMLADRFNSKRIIQLSLLATTVLTLVYAFTMDYTSALIIWILLAFSTGFGFWTSLTKAIGLVGEEKEQGKMYAVYYVCNGLSAAIINAIALYISGFNDDPTISFRNGLIAVAVGTFIAAILITVIYRGNRLETKSPSLNDESEKFRLSDLRIVVKNPFVWAFAVSRFVAYTVYSGSSYLNPYLTDVIGVTATSSSAVTIVRTYVFMFLGLVGAWMCDKVLKSTAKWYMIVFTLMILFFGGLFLLPDTISPAFAMGYTLLAGAVIMSLYGCAWSIIRELPIPKKVLGTAIGMAGCISWLPDVYMNALFGHWLDTAGNAGYTYIFAYFIVTAVIGVLLGYVVYKHGVKVFDKEEAQG